MKSVIVWNSLTLSQKIPTVEEKYEASVSEWVTQCTSTDSILQLGIMFFKPFDLTQASHNTDL